MAAILARSLGLHPTGFMEQGLLNRHEVEALCIPACLRSESEIMEPFAHSNREAPFVVDALTFARTEVELEPNACARRPRERHEEAG